MITPRHIIAKMAGATTEEIRAEIKARLDVDVPAERIDAERGVTSQPVPVIEPPAPADELTEEEADALLAAVAAAPETAALDSAIGKLKTRAKPAPSDAGSFLTTISDPPKEDGASI